jgi:hypothetical protein
MHYWNIIVLFTAGFTGFSYFDTCRKYLGTMIINLITQIIETSKNLNKLIVGLKKNNPYL